MLTIDVENLGKISEVAEPPPQQEADHTGELNKKAAPRRRPLVTCTEVQGIAFIFFTLTAYILPGVTMKV
jgi:hypothetical protein